MQIEWMDRETLDRIIASHVEPVDVVLDIGPGIRPQTFFQPKVHICCEPHFEYVERLRAMPSGGVHRVIVQATGQQFLPLLPDQSVDSIFLIDLIEHLGKAEGRDLLADCKRVARKQVVLFTPLGFLQQEHGENGLDGWGLHGGKWQDHQSGWDPEDFDHTWFIFAARHYHPWNGKGEPFDPPAGAFWAIRTTPVEGSGA